MGSGVVSKFVSDISMRLRVSERERLVTESLISLIEIMTETVTIPRVQRISSVMKC